MDERAAKLNSQGCKFLDEKDYVRAYKYFVEAARLGDENAIYNVGYCCFHGYGVKKNYEVAYRLLRQFVDTKSKLSVTAAYLCGLMLDDGGYGIESDRNQALTYYNKAAEQGHQWSMLMVGRLAQIDREYETARKCIETAMLLAPNDHALQQRGKKLLQYNKILRRSKS